MIRRIDPGLEIQAKQSARRAQQPPSGHPRFADILGQKLQGTQPVRFSNHAAQRLESRAIELTPAQMDAIGRAVDEAAAKGSRESLLLLEDVALIASIRNRTVITAMPTNEATGNVFTNIDSAVVVKTTEDTGPDSSGEGPRAADGLPPRITL